MAIDRSGTWWKGSDAADLEEFLIAYSEGEYRAGLSVQAFCRQCGNADFAVRVDPEEGCAERECAGCGEAVFMLDSAEYADDATLESAACPCGGETFNVAFGFALRDGSSEVRWVYLGLRCTVDGVLGCYADWSIDYSPSADLVNAV